MKYDDSFRPGAYTGLTIGLPPTYFNNWYVSFYTKKRREFKFVLPPFPPSHPIYQNPGLSPGFYCSGVLTFIIIERISTRYQETEQKPYSCLSHRTPSPLTAFSKPLLSGATYPAFNCSYCHKVLELFACSFSPPRFAGTREKWPSEKIRPLTRRGGGGGGRGPGWTAAKIKCVTSGRFQSYTSKVTGRPIPQRLADPKVYFRVGFFAKRFSVRSR